MFDKKKDADTNVPASGATRATSTTSYSNAGSGSVAATIGSSIHIQGDISGAESLVIYGKVEGKISLQNNDVTVGKSGQINADIHAKIIRIEGEVNGDIAGEEKVVITSTGRVRGNIVTPRMTLEDGAKFKGSIDMAPDEPGKPVSSNVREAHAVKKREY